MQKALYPYALLAPMPSSNNLSIPPPLIQLHHTITNIIIITFTPTFIHSSWYYVLQKEEERQYNFGVSSFIISNTHPLSYTYHMCWGHQSPASLLSGHNCGRALTLTIKSLLCCFLSPISFGISGSLMGCKILQNGINMILDPAHVSNKSN